MSSENDWNEDLCGCMNDGGTCLYGFCCTPCLFVLGSVYLCWVPHYFERQKLREKYNLKSNPSCGDCPTTLLCSPCALCQEARELKARESVQRSALKANNNQPVVSQPEANSGEADHVNMRV
ncbi:unnamed protein product [Rotaria socialis]|uniref:Uncharacterized protein n=1 Tax=Rotaria socialis TaxID=392032 RepID=A0A817YKE0_9BILA|nr:unnamed protein product [Rotaria socialis]CAF3367929.1 unnamed protein product [Rotaria socialis]CAF3381630.1 unnamed protein product [Rotaria socialis]CAF3393391.1 unnamed protein product [Rotaria socialis]